MTHEAAYTLSGSHYRRESALGKAGVGPDEHEVEHAFGQPNSKKDLRWFRQILGEP